MGPPCKMLRSDSVDQIFLLSYLEVDFFAFAGEIELVFCPCLCVHVVAGVLLSDTCASDADDVVERVFRDRVEVGFCHVYLFLSDDELYNEGVAFKGVLDGECAQDQQD